jgi:hypothetical protein
MRLVGLAGMFVACCLAGIGAAADVTVSVSIVDQAGQPVSGAHIQLQSGESAAVSADTDQAGHAEFKGLPPGRYAIAAAKEGFRPLVKGDLDFSQSGAAMELTLVPVLTQRESVEVTGQAPPVEEGASTANTVNGKEAKTLPDRPATVSDALPLTPGVARQPGGGLQISGAGEHRSSLIVNSADVTDPATGQFGLTVPMDSVETLNVFQTPFLAEYGRFTAGLVSVETRRGGDKWKWELNDPLPDFFIRSWRLRGLRDATPRLNFEGPLVPGKLYFSEGLEYEVRKTPVFTQTFPDNLKRKQGINSFAQADWVASEKNLVTLTVHAAPQRLGHVNMNAYNPLETTPDASTHNYTTTLGDHLTLGSGLLDSTLSYTRFDANVWSLGDQDLTMAPQGNSGNYFAGQNRIASRLGLLSVYSFAPWKHLGQHNYKLGGYVAKSTDRGQVSERPVDIVDITGLLLQRIAFTSGQPFDRSDTEIAFFGQDHWMITPRLAIDIGVRTESQAVSETFRLAPRGGISWNPFSKLGTVVSAGFGLFFDRVPLSVYSFPQIPDQIVTTYNADGSVASGPILYINGLGEVFTHRRFVYLEPTPGNFAPRSTTWNAQVEQPITKRLKLRASYMSNISDGLVLLDRSVPNPATGSAANLLSGNGQAHYRQLEITNRVALGHERQLLLSYVNSRARGDLNEFSGFIGSFPVPIIHANQFGTLPTDLPNRFLAWGSVPLPGGFGIAPVVEYRSGFPYVSLDALQHYAGIPNQNRFPNFLSADARLWKDIALNPKYSVRLSVSGFNLSNHFNPEALHWNTADPAYGLFWGQRGRRLTVDFDVLF